MNVATLKTRFRAHCNRLLLNPVFTKTYDLISPVHNLGDRGERCAQRHLMRQGLLIVDRSFKNSIGEIDFVAIDDRTIVFVEVKTRTTDSAGVPAEAVDDLKQKKITKTATSYLKHHDLLDYRCRFDVVSIIWPSAKGKPQIEHFVHAFSASDDAW